MKRLIMLAAMVVLGLVWPEVAFAQLGVPSLGPEPGPRPRTCDRSFAGVREITPPLPCPLHR